MSLEVIAEVVRVTFNRRVETGVSAEWTTAVPSRTDISTPLFIQSSTIVTHVRRMLSLANNFPSGIRRPVIKPSALRHRLFYPVT